MELTSLTKNVAKVNSNGQVEIFIRENIKTTRGMAMEK